MSSAGDTVDPPIVTQHGTAERNVEEIDPGTAAGNTSAGSGEISFEVIPPPYVSPPGLADQQRAAFEKSDQVPISSIASDNGDGNSSETTMTMLKLMQQQMEMQMAMMKRMENREERRDEENRDPKGNMKWRGVKLDIKHFSRVTSFSGDHNKFRDWFFGVNTVIGTIDQRLCGALKVLLEEDNKLKAEDQPPKENNGIPQDLKEEYTTELFGLWTQLTEGDAKEMCSAYERDF